MSNALYDTGRNAFLNGSISFAADVIKMAIVGNTYQPSLAKDQFFKEITAHVIGTPQTLTDKTTSAGVASCGNVTFATVPAGNTVKYIVVYQDTGVPGTSQLIALLDTATGLPIVTNGGDIVLNIDTGSSKLFKL